MAKKSEALKSRFLLKEQHQMNKLVTVYMGPRGAFYIKRGGRKVYVHWTGWGYRDMDAHKKNKLSYQVIEIGSSVMSRRRG